MIKDFLVSHNLEKTPLLLGLSGGPDSMALFHLLLDLKHPFQVAHIDHGWRKESREEACYLAKICEKAAIKYHEYQLNVQGANLENISRNARHAFFEKICELEGLKGVVLGHHADDQAETVLKRVFEGASLPKLKGLVPIKQIGRLTLYRPLLKVKKREIIDWLEKKQISFFYDPTNHDSRFLRSRLRHTLLPTLSKQFGKQIQNSLCRLGEEAAELTEFLEGLISPFKDQVIESEDSISIDFNPFSPQSLYIYKAVIRDLFRRQNLTPPKSILEAIIWHLQKNSVRKCLQVAQKKVEIDRRILTIKKLKL